MKEKVAIILAAGASSRMNTQLPKVLHEVSGRPMLAYVLRACRAVNIQRILVVVGFGADQVKARYRDAQDILWIEQTEQRGTAHAVLCCREHLEAFDGDTMILCGDGPLIRAETLETLIEKHDSENSKATLATALLPDPSGYGRIARDRYGNIQGIVEHSDCTPEQLDIKEVNPSYYLFDNQLLFELLAQVKPDNVKQELYLTDAVAGAISLGHKVLAITAVRPEEAMGVNSRAQLSAASKIMQQRIQQDLMDNGVTIVDPDNTWIDAGVEIGLDTVIEPFTYIHGEVEIGQRCRIGPFAYVTGGTVLEDDVTLGVFTEIDNSRLSEGVQARHHSYLGDASVGKDVTVGAGAITANFNGSERCHTAVGPGSHIGAGAILVAPMKLKPGVMVEAGSVVTQESVLDMQPAASHQEGEADE